MNLGNITVGQVLYFHFTTRQFSTGTPITSALLAVSVYKDDNTTESTTGITTTFSSGFDGVAGLVSVKIDTSADGTFYATGHDFSIVVTGGTSDGVSIIGEVVGYFSIANRSAAVSDKTGFSLSSDGIQAIWDALTSALTTVGSIGKLLVDNINATITSRMATYTQPTGFLAATFPGAVASTTNITAGTITTVTNLTNAATSGDFTADMKTSLNAATPSVTVSDKTGFSLTAAYDPAKTAAQAGDAMTLTAGERISVGTAVWVSATRTLTSFGTLITDIWSAASRTLTAFGFSVTVGTNNDKTDYTLTAAYDAAKTAAQAGDSMDVATINGTAVTGTGQAGDLWRG